MQRYVSHKKVNAGKIAAIEVIENGVSKIALESGEVVCSSPDWFRANTARRDEDELIGGYYVLYEDGYDSWSPASAFESGYVPVGD